MKKQLEPNSIHAIVSDPPYGLGFMGKSWDTFKDWDFMRFNYKWGCGAFRVLKSGAPLVAFSGTRTYDLLAVGLRMAKFKIKDMLSWMYGSGFPKSLDISKAIDGHLGVEFNKGELLSENTAMSGGNYTRPQRKVIGVKLRHGGGINEKYMGMTQDKEIELTEPYTKEALEWDGWGTALKPAFEPIVLAQKSYENTYAENVLKYGVGGLNIDACRVGTTQADAYDLEKRPISKGLDEDNRNVKFSAPPKLDMTHGVQTKGRYPSNVLLSHLPSCVAVGTKHVGSGQAKHNQDITRKGMKFNGAAFNTGNCNFDVNKCQGLGNYGVEEVEAWECHPDCPVFLLDQQSGDCKVGGKIYSKKLNKKEPTLNFTGENRHEYEHIDKKGGASRFFKTFSGTRFIYNGKAHKSERNAGLKDLPDVKQPKLKESSKFCIKCGKREDYKCNCNVDFEYKLQPGYENTTKNDIATLKPVNVMRYLVRLVCPKGGTVLDPFGGSGTTAIACIIEGFNYIIIEKRERFAKEIIPKRLEWWSNPDNWSILKDHNALPKIETLKKKRQNVGMDKWLA